MYFRGRVEVIESDAIVGAHKVRNTDYSCNLSNVIHNIGVHDSTNAVPLNKLLNGIAGTTHRENARSNKLLRGPNCHFLARI